MLHGVHTYISFQGGLESVSLQHGNWALEGTIAGILTNLLQLRWEGGLQVTLSGLHLRLRILPSAKLGGSSKVKDGSSSSGMGDEGGQASKPKKRRSRGAKEIALPAWIVNAMPGFGIRVENITVTHVQVWVNAVE